MSNNTLTPVKLAGWKEPVPGGYVLHSGWALRDTAGALVSFTGRSPWMPRGGKRATQEVAASGLHAYTAVAAQ